MRRLNRRVSATNSAATVGWREAAWCVAVLDEAAAWGERVADVAGVPFTRASERRNMTDSEFQNINEVRQDSEPGFAGGIAPDVSDANARHPLANGIDISG